MKKERDIYVYAISKCLRGGTVRLSFGSARIDPSSGNSRPLGPWSADRQRSTYLVKVNSLIPSWNSIRGETRRDADRGGRRKEMESMCEEAERERFLLFFLLRPRGILG